MMTDSGEHRSVVLFGERIAYRQIGDRGPVVVLLHGMADSGHSWDMLLPHLPTEGSGAAMTILVPDLLGHGLSAKPRTDYSLGAHANMLRDLLDRLGHDRVTMVGHSLGGGIALQFAYQYRQRVEALMLVASGGFGGDVAGLLRAAALPGSGMALRLLTARPVRWTIGALGGVLARALPGLGDVEDVRRLSGSLVTAEARAACLATLRAVIDPSGQRVSAMNRLPAAAQIPTLLVWGSRDPIISVRHAHQAHELIPGSRLVIFPEAGHFPHRHEPARFADLLQDFVHGVDRVGDDQLAVVAGDVSLLAPHHPAIRVGDIRPPRGVVRLVRGGSSAAR
jgi:pimeloyl-ACP methyl ester carboxylesterase